MARTPLTRQVNENSARSQTRTRNASGRRDAIWTSYENFDQRPARKLERSMHALRAFCPPSAPRAPVLPMYLHDLPPMAEIEESTVRTAVRSLHPHSAPGPDVMTLRLLHLLVTSPITPLAGVTGLSALTNLVRILASGNLPHQTIPLLSAATLLPLNSRPGKIRRIAIGQVLRRVVMKTLLPAAIEDTREYLHPIQKANGIGAGLDAIMHDTRMITDRNACKTDFVIVSIDASNVFIWCSRQRFLDALPQFAPSLARFCNQIYAGSAPPLIIPASPPQVIQSREATQQGDPPSMLLFSLAVRELLRELGEICNLQLTVAYADDMTLTGPLPEILKALRILHTTGPHHQF